MLPDGTWSFDASPDYSEFSFLHSGNNHTAAQVFVPDSAVKRHGSRSCHLTQFSNSINPFNANTLDSRVGIATNDTEGSEAWYGLSWRWPAGQPANTNFGAHFQFIPNQASLWPSYGPFSFQVEAGAFSLLWKTGRTPSTGTDYNPIPPNGYKATVKLLGTGAPRPWTKDVWHDFYFHVVWNAHNNGVFELWHREEGLAFVKLYSNIVGGAAMILANPHPTMMYNDQNGSPTYHAEWGLYTNLGAGSNFWIDGFRRRQSQAAMLAEFPSSSQPVNLTFRVRDLAGVQASTVVQAQVS